ncbi:hypothetical protein CXG81DRAFT_25615 [Caulochytrium protostelioides]|uniref:NADH dehydrogenase [ubiquinone] 1 alpha subcomplex subunit n=1 Tax=Caulochytrium protostelioides TaxID=1555241 RepID=A0A4P9X8W8_9FUNG|nr:hypothetical protein CXG81DRAFT_25615 [Caulochytrium protostelioides]|eukprot:RKP01712.1 hypothetical protein CXG81DRAFT_25615 [Caulochytrium protostelioides]
MWQRIAQAVRRLTQGPTARYIGADFAGNKYYETDIPTGSRPTRRSVVMLGDQDRAILEPNALPPMWAMWLRHTRADPPTPEELAAEDRRFTILKERVRAIDAREAERREQLQRQAAQDLLHVATPAPSRKAVDPNGGAEPSSSSPSPSPSQPTQPDPFARPKQTNPGEDWEPEAWTPAPAARPRRGGS